MNEDQIDEAREAINEIAKIVAKELAPLRIAFFVAVPASANAPPEANSTLIAVGDDELLQVLKKGQVMPGLNEVKQ